MQSYNSRPGVKTKTAGRLRLRFDVQIAKKQLSMQNKHFREAQRIQVGWISRWMSFFRASFQ